MTARAALAAIVAASLLGTLVTGCRKHEQDRVLLYEKGVYLGKHDTPLTEQQMEALHQRTSKQGPMQ